MIRQYACLYPRHYIYRKRFFKIFSTPIVAIDLTDHDVRRLIDTWCSKAKSRSSEGAAGIACVAEMARLAVYGCVRCFSGVFGEHAQVDGCRL